MKDVSRLTKLIQFFFHNRLITFVSLGIILIFSVYAFQSLSIDAYPDISGIQVQIITEFRGRSTEEVEQQVTIPIERVFAGVSNLDTIRSKSIFGLSVVQLLFDAQTTDEFVREQVNQRIRTIDLPEGVHPTMGSLSTAYGEIYRYELVTNEPQNYPLAKLRELQDWVVKPAFLRAKGVVEVVSFGGIAKQYAVFIDPRKLIQFGVRLQEIVQAIQENNNNGGGSILERGSSSIVIRGIGRYYNYAEMENVFIKNSFGTDVFIRDLGQVVEDHKPITGIFGKDKNDSSIEGIIKMRRGENPSVVLEKVHALETEINQRLLPKGVKIKPFYDRTILIEETLQTVLKNTILGILLVIAVLYLFLSDLKLALIVSLTIPFSIMLALSLMYLTGIPISLLSIGSIDFGILVDGSVIIIENIHRKLHDVFTKQNQELKPEQTKKLSKQAKEKETQEYTPTENIFLEATKEVQKPMIFSMLIVLLAYIPLLSLQKIEGLLFKPMAITICFALLGAILFALFVIPLLSSLFLSHKGEENKNRFFAWIETQYSAILPILLDQKGKFLKALGVFIFLSAILLYPKMGMEFLPYMDEGVFWLRANFPEGTSLKETEQFASEIRNVLLTYHEISFVTSQAGRNEDGTDPFPLNRIEFMIGLKNRSQWKNFSNKPDLEKDIAQKLRLLFRTTRLNLTQPIIDSVTEDTNGTSADLAVDISGPDLDTLREKAYQAKMILREIRGSVNVNIEQEGPQPQLKILINKEKLSLYRISASALNYVINTAIGGIPISEIYENERKFEILVKYSPEDRESVKKIGLLPVFNEQGEAIPLGQLCEIKVDEGETIIYRADGKRRITVRTDIRNRAQNDFTKEAKEKLEPLLEGDTNVEIQWLGMFENLTRAKRHFALLIPISLVSIFLLLFFFYGSFLLSAIILITIPIATLGSFYALAFRDFHLSVSAGVGFTTLFGIAAMHGILLISKISSLEKQGLNRRKAIQEGSENRLRPVLMTASVAFIGLLPASLSHEIGSDIQRPIATVMIWGIIVSVFLTLFFIPVLYETLLNYRDKNFSPKK